MNYDFSQLNDKEFEMLACDLLSKHLGVRIERFKAGRDGGVDGRFFSVEDKETVIQVKHYLKTGVSGLLASLKNKELSKVQKLKPDSYIIVTSLPLSRANKKKIKEVFSKYIKSESDIYGQEDLNDILANNADIEEKYFKLWITSTTVLKNILNNAIKGRSRFELRSIKEKSYKYVQTENHYRALDILEKNNAIIISGEPGIGKTTLAENIALFYASKGYEFVDIQEDLSEAEDVYSIGDKQLFYFDDFLGSNYFEAIENKKDSHISKFIERVKKDKTKKFILTSRTNIFNSGLLHSSIFASKNIKQDEFLLKIDELTDLEKGKILYNHIWFSDLAEDYIEVLYSEKRYHQVIMHKNFNPRLIEFITDSQRVSNKASEYWDFVIKILANSKGVWDNAFKIQSNDYVRILVLLTVFNGKSIEEPLLKKGYNKFLSLESITNPSHTAKDFNTTVKLATKAFLNRSKYSSGVEYSLFNPSISDYIFGECIQGSSQLITIYKSLYSVASLRKLHDLHKTKIISNEQLNAVLEALFNCSFEGEHSYDYLIFLCDIFMLDEVKEPIIASFLSEVISHPKAVNEFSLFIELIDQMNIYNGKSHGFLLELFRNRYLDFDELQSLFSFIDKHQIVDKELFSELEMQLEVFLSDDIEELKSDMDISDYLRSTKGYDGDDDIDIDECGVIERLEEGLERALLQFDSKIIKKLKVNIDGVIDDNLDVDQLLSNYFKSMGQEDYLYEKGNSATLDKVNDIDDLFERI